MENTLKEITIDDILKNQKSHNSRANLKLIRKAYDYAKELHGDQLRKSGEPYLIHPINVAYILTELELDDESVCAALLHDVVEDTEYTVEDLANLFGITLGAGTTPEIPEGFNPDDYLGNN